MTKQRLMYLLSPAVVATATIACTPTHDLDAVSAGNASTGTGGVTSSGTPGATMTGGSPFDQSGVGGNAAGGLGLANTGGIATIGGMPATGGAVSSVAGGLATFGGANAGGTAGAPYGGTFATGAAPNTSGGSSIIVGGTAGEPGSGGAATSPAPTGGQATETGGVANAGGVSAITGGVSSVTGGVSATGGTRPTNTIAPDLGDLLNTPVQGYISYSSTATWDIGGVQREAFRIETPTATYFVVKSVAAITSLVDANNTPWVLYNTGYRTHRGVPNLGGCCQPNPPAPQPTMTTVLDAASVTSTHLRLVSKPTDGDYYWLVWDFYVTHVTVTVNRSQAAFGFTYDGVPGNTLDNNDHLVLSNGDIKSSTGYYSADLPGPAEWAYIANGEGTKSGSLFLIQHTDDNLPETYSVPDGDGSRFTFGTGQITSTPIRFSLGLINSTDHAAVSTRVKYVIDNIPP